MLFLNIFNGGCYGRCEVEASQDATTDRCVRPT
jgi:hypothetical protein